MSFHVHKEGRRDAPRFPIRSDRHREWIPRGGSPASSSSSTSTVVNPIPPSFDSNPNRSSTLPENRRRENSFVRRTSYVTRPRREGETQKDGNLPELVQEIQDRLVKGTVECMICCDMVRRTAPIWSCASCFSIFHLSCIKKWARTPTSIDLSAEKNNQGSNWRCPGCQSVQLVLTSSREEFRYVCFCGKRPDPPSDPYLTPHSCGESCGKPLEIANHGDDDYRCPHVCVLQCHPGPCPPCKAFAPPRMCPCGKKTITRRCSDRNSVPTCGQLCDKLLKCGRHRCERVCHPGPCDSCGVPINASCFCNKKMEVVLCGELPVEGELKVNYGAFSCSLACGKKLGCENHVCEEICHPGPCGVCELTPWKIRTCNCGKTKLQEERQSCLDPIPTCSQICGKPLHCGIHYCKEVCHGGSCAPCLVLVNQKCRCGCSSRTVECYRTTEEDDKFFCEKPCGRKRSCGRHRCSERCCPLSNSNNQLSGDSNPHSCSIVCGKKLRCGQHNCESFCHTGHCPPCLETIFTDLTCACGKTSIPPPLPCGTPPPSCEHPCSAPQPCGHSSSHSCHFGDCPSCSVPVEKECIGGHVVLRNIHCGSREIRCNQLCGKPRQCGMHACARTCHPPPCDSSCGSGSGSGSKVSCSQICGAPRRDCRHTCTSTCHPSAVCPDIRCNFPVTITCSCGRITAIVPCDAGGSMDRFHIDTIFEASVIQKLPVPLQQVEANAKKVPLGQRKLVCDDECAKMERKRVLADAFDITPPNLDSLHFGENSVVPDLLAHLFRREPKWVLSVEERFKFLVLGKNKGSTGNGFRVHVFCPMIKEKRDAVRQIAERWKLSVQASGWEPKQFLVVHVTPKSKAPARVFGAQGGVPLNVSNAPAFDPLVDMDPRLVVALLDLPRDANISALVLRFGGECELVWLNDKNALAVFSDPSRATIALRRLDHGSPYHGAVVVIQNVGASVGANAWGGGMAKEGGAVQALKGNPWKTAVVEEVGWREDSWGGEDCSGGVTDMQPSVWKRKEGPISTTRNRWNVLDPDALSSSAAATVGIEYPEPLVNEMERPFTSELEAKVCSLDSERLPEVGANEVEPSEVVNDWEEACE
ncbi:hypothetical protein HHK36_019852 [Tetracentron sinense]|uniref:NF-X1-type zinc finger protein NFXL1 n=1 Tax=Tetracentron sinense TaxID=13715 RepID=A0A835DCN4_TETSI|nr:hypothetical protein HHK36_019852 [Tetracentron sinense]